MPDQLGLPFALWTSRAVRELIARRLAKRLGLTAGDCPKFRVRVMTKGRKEPSHGTTQSAGDPG